MLMELSEWEEADRREGPRVRLKLRLVIIYPQQGDRPARPMFHGKTHDIGLSGLSMLVDYNVFQEGEVTVVLAMPPGSAGAARKVVTSTAEMTYAIHSSKLDAFKIGLTFREFRGDGKERLEAALRQALKAKSADGAKEAGSDAELIQPGESQQQRGW
jgi:hypothetical protein